MSITDKFLTKMIDIITDIIFASFKDKLKKKYKRTSIQLRIKSAVTEAIYPLEDFLKHERIGRNKIERLAEVCSREIKRITKDDSFQYKASIDPMKYIGDYYEGSLPQEILEDGTDSVYLVVLGQIVKTITSIFTGTNEWHKQAWKNAECLLDSIADQLSYITSDINEIRLKPQREADMILRKVKTLNLQKLNLSIDLTCLRSNSPCNGNIDQMFVLPEFEKVLTKEEEEQKRRLCVSLDTEVIEQLNEYKHIIIVGDPGSGKSTWSKWFQKQILRDSQEGLCFRIELRGYRDKDLPKINDLVRDNCSIHQSEKITADRLTKWFQKGKITVILDGIDELTIERRDHVEEWVKDLSTAEESCRIVLTTRPLTSNHIENLKEQFSEFRLMPFDRKRIEEYIEKWYNHTPELHDRENVNASELYETLTHDPTIAHLTGNPLLLTTLLMIHYLDGKLPEGRSLVYKRYIEGMLGIWDDKRKLSVGNPNIKKHNVKILCRLAIHMFFKDEYQLEEKEIRTVLEGILREIPLQEDADTVLSYLIERTGLLTGPGVFSFNHKSLIEYFVAYAINEGNYYWPDGHKLDRLHLMSQRNNDNWRTVLFLWAGLTTLGDLESFIDSVMEDADVHIAFSLIYDQLDRLSHNKIREWIFHENVFQYMNQKIDNCRHTFHVLGPFEKSYIEFPGISISGINGRCFLMFCDLIAAIHKRNIIRIKEIDLASNKKYYYYIWFSFISISTNIKIMDHLPIVTDNNSYEQEYLRWAILGRLLRWGMLQPGKYLIYNKILQKNLLCEQYVMTAVFYFFMERHLHQQNDIDVIQYKNEQSEPLNIFINTPDLVKKSLFSKNLWVNIFDREMHSLSPNEIVKRLLDEFDVTFAEKMYGKENAIRLHEFLKKLNE